MSRDSYPLGQPLPCGCVYDNRTDKITACASCAADPEAWWTPAGVKATNEKLLAMEEGRKQVAAYGAEWLKRKADERKRVVATGEQQESEKD